VTELWVAVDTRAECTVVSVRGKIMFDTQEPFGEALIGALKASEPRIVVDLREVAVCDSTGLQLLIDAHRQAVAAGGWLRLCRPQPLVERVLDITNLAGVLRAYPSVDAAVSDARPPGSDGFSADRTV
jgi:anti-sigma B factor antagonist